MPQKFPAILSLDIGTSSTRAVLYQAETGLVVPGTAFFDSHEPDATADGGSSIAPDLLLQEALSCMAQSLASAPHAEVIAVASCTFWHSTIGVNRHCEEQTSVLLWSDRRSANQVADLRDSLDDVAYTERTGCPIHTSYLPGRLVWLRDNFPEVFSECVRFVSPGEYIYGKLFGPDRIAQSWSMASGTGLWNAHAEMWDTEILSLVPGLTPAHFAPVSDDPVSGLLSPYKEQFPRLAQIPWYPALGDGACSNLGAGGVTPDRIALMIGTSGAMRVAVPGITAPRVPPGLWRYRADKERFLVGGALSNGGSVWSWLTETMQLPTTGADDLLAAMPPDGHGLTVLPFLSGERAPLWRDDLTGAILGLTQATTPLEIARASFEAVGYRFAAIRERLRTVVPKAEIIGTGGGLLRSTASAQILADVMGEPVTLSGEPEGSSRGAALWVCEKLGMGRLEDAPFAMGRRFLPNPDNTEVYAKARERHEDVLSRLG
ncbi:MAG: gluconokinase [Akkermansiaceae bacterium]|nr:gluconokinase [Armatimonadota bacterium]